MSAPGRQNLPVLVDLKDGRDSFLGFPNRKHVFLVGEGPKNFTGGSADDVFVIQFFPFRGHLDGAGGENTLILDGDGMYPSDFIFGRPYAAMPRVAINLLSCDKSSTSSCESQFKNFHRVIGWSKKPDSLVTDCAVTGVDLNSGQSAANLDQITIPSLDCSTSLALQLRAFTRLDNFHEANGQFTYQVEFAPSIQVNLDPEKNVHKFVFTNDIITAQLSHRSGYIFIANKKENKEFKCNYIKSASSTFLLITQQGLSINFDRDSDSFYGLMSPSPLLLPSRSGFHEVRGLVNYPNRFVISANSNLTLNWTGGDKNDIFVLREPIQPRGSIDGSDGLDSLILQQDFQPEATISLDFLSKVLSPGELQILKMETVIGRPALPDMVKGSCELIHVDLRGGSENRSDAIEFSSQLFCDSNLTVMVRKYTTVANLASSGDFSYHIELVETSGTMMMQANFIQVSMERNGSATHKYIFLRKPSSVTDITFDQVSEQFQIHFDNSDTWAGRIPMRRSMIYVGDQIMVQVFPEIRGIVRLESSSSPSAPAISGLQNFPNTFFVGITSAPDASVTGGRMDDTFFITSENFHGKLDGDLGINTLCLTDSLWREQAVTVNALQSSLLVKSGNETVQQLEFSGIQRILGREGQPDVIMAGCYTKLIDTKGGGSTVSYDFIRISSLPDCFFFLDVTIRPNIVVMNDATGGEFKYEGDFRNGGGSTFMFLTFTPYIYHKVYLDMDSHEYNNLELTDGRVNITATDGSQFSVDFFIPEGADSHTQPSIFFRDGLELKIFGNGPTTSTLFGTLRSGSRNDILEEDTEEGNEISERKRREAEDVVGSELIQRYQRAAKNAQVSVMMRIGSETLVSIGSGGALDLLTAVPGNLNNILVCNNATETIYRIANGSSNVQIIFDLESSGPKLLDLTPIVRNDFEVFPALHVLHDKDLMIQIKGVEITIKGLANASCEVLKSWQVLLREVFLNIEEDSGSFKLVAQPILIDPKTVDSFVVHVASLEPGMQILTASNNGSHPIKYEAVKQGDNLVFTNLFQQDWTDDAATSVVFYDFYKAKAPEALRKKRVIFELEAGVMVNVTLEMGKDVPTFEQRAWETFGHVNLLFFILPTLAVFLVGAAWLCWSKWYKSLKVFQVDPLLIGGRRSLKTGGMSTEYELVPKRKPEELLMDGNPWLLYRILSDLPAKFQIIERPLPIFQGLLRLQNFNSYDRYCRSSIECLEGYIPLPHVLVRALFSPQAECIRVVEDGTNFVVALPTESVSNVAKVLFTLCLRKRSAVIRYDQGEIIHGVRRIMQILLPSCAEFIEQEKNPSGEVVGDGICFSARFTRFVLWMTDGKEHQVVVNTEGRFRLLDEPESALSSFDELRMRIQMLPRESQAFSAVHYMDEALEAACLEELNNAT